VDLFLCQAGHAVMGRNFLKPVPEACTATPSRFVSGCVQSATRNTRRNDRSEAYCRHASHCQNSVLGEDPCPTALIPRGLRSGSQITETRAPKAEVGEGASPPCEEQRLRGRARSPPSHGRPDRKESIPSDGECARCVWGRADRIHDAPRDPERVIPSYGEPLIGCSMLAQPGIDFDVRQFQPCGNEHFKNWR
jgi:hypothetical protein